VCVDVLFINKERKVIYLAKRAVDPLPDWWFIGGRLNAGEKGGDGIVRKMKWETSLEVAPERFQFLVTNRYIFTKRKQEPKDAGVDTLAYTYVLELTDEEREVVVRSLDPKEYEVSLGLREFDRAAIIAENLHPAVLDAYDLAFPASV
jgi:hypothetical protein